MAAEKILFMGSPDFAVPTMFALAESFNVIGVVTQPDRPAGRGRAIKPPPIKTLAQELGLPVIQPKKLSEQQAMAQLRRWDPDVIVVAAFGQILRSDVLNLPRYGCVNVHASLLPRWRGATPIQAAILHGDSQTGVTIMLMDAGVDTGPTIAQRSVLITPQDTTGSLSERLSGLGAELIIEALPGYLSGNITPEPQDDTQATYAPMLKKADGELDFNQPAEKLVRQVRAYHPWPGTFTTWNDQRLNIHRAEAVPRMEDVALQPGSRTIQNDLPAFATSKGLLVLHEVQPAGKKSMDGRAFLQGARVWI